MAENWMYHQCTGPVCQGTETLHIYVGDVVINGEEYRKMVCSECIIAPPGKTAEQYQWTDDSGNVLREFSRRKP